MSSVTLMHPKSVGQNEMPFGRDTRVVSSNTVLDRDPGISRKVKIWGRNPGFAAMQPTAKYLAPVINSQRTKLCSGVIRGL